MKYVCYHSLNNIHFYELFKEIFYTYFLALIELNIKYTY